MSNATSPDGHALVNEAPWLDDITGEQALAWVRERNEETETTLASTRLEEIEAEVLEVLQSPDRIPQVSIRGTWAYNFWTDSTHPRGLWRRQNLDVYLDGGEDWEVLLDVDALAAAEGRSLVFHGAQVLYPERDRALIDLSEGGQDADETREFDLIKKSFIPEDGGGFRRPTAKGSLTWIDRDTVWASTEAGEGSTSASGYPLQARLLSRGQALAEAPVVISGGEGDLGVFAEHDPTPGYERSIVQVAHDFLHCATYLLRDLPCGQPKRLDVPETANVSLWRDWLLLHLHEDWETGGPLGTCPGGSLVAFPLEAYLAGTRAGQVLFTPDERSSLTSMTSTRHHVVLTVMVDVITHLEVRTPPERTTQDEAGSAPRAWSSRTLGGAALVTGTDVATAEADIFTISARAAQPLESDRLWVSASGFLTPSTLILADLDPRSGEVTATRLVRRAPAMFDASQLAATQHFATSADGTRVPYFHIGPTGGGPTPILLQGYGGFGVSLTPGYMAALGRAFLKRGGSCVMANIRGGGEYGPSWHEAARGPANKQRSYEDFEAVARDLIARGATTPSQLGIQGGSNGGLLTGNMLLRCPDLFGAVVIQAPLLDMARFHTLSAGSSWIAEYGDPTDPEQWELIRQYSPFHLLGDLAESTMSAPAATPSSPLPPVLVTTSTRDDRVHPAHARTFVHRLRRLGSPVLYHENVEGGHSGAADAPQRAHLGALVWEFLLRELA